MHQFSSIDRQCPERRERFASAIQRAEQLGEDWFHQAEAATSKPPLKAIQALHDRRLLQAPVCVEFGGLGLGTDSGTHLALLRILAALGGADLALGRLYEGHVNAIILVQSYGSPEQIEDAAQAAQAGMLFGVWNTGATKPMQLEEQGTALALKGLKTFATGAGFVQRPVVTVEHHGWQMTMPHLDNPAVAGMLQIDRDSWQPLGMESSESLTVDFTGVPLSTRDLLGKPGDFYRDPLFRGGAVRFAAVQTGALVRLARMFAEWLKSRGRQNDPYQIARLGEVELLAQEAVLWTERAAAIADRTLHKDAELQQTTSMIRFANMHRLAVQRTAHALMAHVVAGVGAHGLLRPARFERIVRDLTMYLRQPNPDGTLADVGRSALCDEVGSYWATLNDVLAC